MWQVYIRVEHMSFFIFKEIFSKFDDDLCYFWYARGKQKQSTKILNGFELIDSKKLSKRVKKQRRSFYAIPVSHLSELLQIISCRVSLCSIN